jgi:pyrroline-5-carboxylate reductase
MTTPHITFIGGGNMASALIGGLYKQGYTSHHIDVVEPLPEAYNKLRSRFGITALTQPGPTLTRAALVVWAVKPQTFKDAALQTRLHTKHALHLSVAAGIRSDSIANWLGTQRVVRAMPNTPALVGLGMTGLYARDAVSQDDRDLVEKTIAPTGQQMWVNQESLLDAVTALSGSGPAYVFYFLEAMTQAGADMGLTMAQAHELAVATFLGASALARNSSEPPALLRERVTSKGGTTHAAITSLEQDHVHHAFIRAIRAAHHRAQELGDEFGR